MTSVRIDKWGGRPSPTHSISRGFRQDFTDSPVQTRRVPKGLETREVQGAHPLENERE